MKYVTKTNLKADKCLDIYNFDIYLNQSKPSTILHHS